MAAVMVQGEMPLEVQLPQLVGLGSFEAHVWRVLGALCGIDEPMAFENGADGALGRHVGDPLVLQHSGQHVRALGGVHLAQRDDALLQRRARAVRTGVRAVRTVTQALRSPRRVPPQPLVAGLAADGEPTTQFAHTHCATSSQRNKLFPGRHTRFHLPRHGHPPAARFSMPIGVTYQPEQVLPINPVYTLPRERALTGASCEGWYVQLLLNWHNPAIPSAAILNARTQTLSPGRGL